MTKRHAAKLVGLTVSLFLIAIVGIANADPINWVSDWALHSPGATGMIIQNGVVIDVTYSGHIAQLAPASYWAEGTPPPYTGNPVVDNAPTSGITLNLSSDASPDYANILTFSLPLIDPVFALYSVGTLSLGVPYEFDQGFTLLSEGSGAWGDGTFTISGNTITGHEGHGVIQLSGAVSSIAWNNPVAENHHGFTLGVQAEIMFDCNIFAVSPAPPWSTGDTFTILGTGFLEGSVPLIGGIEAAPFTQISATEIAATVPVMADGEFSLVVSMPGGIECVYDQSVVGAENLKWGTLKTIYR
ncbi:MAG: IPT/TIG domain-containing protein [Deltaproteobacteria bacterium]|nr:IPT/TIG domain-containing protein [Deltaproteobacteria bacterium]